MVAKKQSKLTHLEMNERKPTGGPDSRKECSLAMGGFLGSMLFWGEFMFKQGVECLDVWFAQ